MPTGSATTFKEEKNHLLKKFTLKERVIKFLETYEYMLIK